jgi:VWFA-related protein
MRARSALSHVFALAALAALLPAAPAPAGGREAPASVFGEVLDVRVVNVEVVVTDGRDERVAGLAAGDFRLRVDGREVPIAYFSEVRIGGAVAAPAGEEPAPAREAPAAVAPGPVATHYLVFVDDYFTVGAHRNRVLARLAEQVTQLGPADRMALAAFDGRRLEVLSPFTGSGEELARRFEEAAQRPAKGAFDRVTRRNFQLSAKELGSSGAGSHVWVPVGDDLGGQERGYYEWLKALLKAEVGAASTAMRALSGVPGRKVLLLLAGAWPLHPEDHAGNRESFLPERGQVEGRELYRPLIETANLLGYTVYPVDVSGIETVAADVDASPPPPAVLGEYRFGNAGDRASSASIGTAVPESNVDATFQILARETGGRALVNTLRDRALATAAEDTRTYYWLGFVPDRKRDDRPHTIEVDVARRGLRARSRRSFLDLSRGAEVSARVEGGLLLGRPASARPLPVKLGEIREQGRKLEVPILVGIPVDAITILPVGKEFVAELELRVGVLDAGGTLSDVSVQPLRLASEKMPRAGGLVRYDTRLTLEREEHDVVLALLDPATGNVLSSHFKLGKP